MDAKGKGKEWANAARSSFETTRTRFGYDEHDAVATVGHWCRGWLCVIWLGFRRITPDSSLNFISWRTVPQVFSSQPSMIWVWESFVDCKKRQCVFVCSDISAGGRRGYRRSYTLGHVTWYRRFPLPSAWTYIVLYIVGTCKILMDYLSWATNIKLCHKIWQRPS